MAAVTESDDLRSEVDGALLNAQPSSDLHLQHVDWSDCLDMTSLLDVILIDPIQESLLYSLPLGALLNLSKTNSSFRAAFHGFRFERHDHEMLPSTKSRTLLYLGQHNTVHWKCCKSKSLLLCSESQHVRGEKIRGCRVCSMPVCEACVIKSSFGKTDARTFSNRTRSLCPDCYDLGNVHEDRLSEGNVIERPPSQLIPGERPCICTAKDGHLCFACKTKQKCDAKENLDQCHGEGCSRAKDGGFAGRVCLWCDRRLSRENGRATTRRDYDLRHLLARSHSMYERASDDEILNPATQASQATPYKARARPLDPIEEERQRLLSDVSARRSLTADAAEEERWRRSEFLRRSETFIPPPPIRRCTTPAMNSRSWRDTDSIAPTLVERDYWEASDPPGYSLEYHRPAPEQKQRWPMDSLESDCMP